MNRAIYLYKEMKQGEGNEMRNMQRKSRKEKELRKGEVTEHNISGIMEGETFGPCIED